MATMLADDYKKYINTTIKEDEGEDGSISEEKDDSSKSTSCVTKSRGKDFYLGGNVKKAERQRMSIEKILKFQKT